MQLEENERRIKFDDMVQKRFAEVCALLNDISNFIVCVFFFSGHVLFTNLSFVYLRRKIRRLDTRVQRRELDRLKKLEDEEEERRKQWDFKKVKNCRK